MPRITAAFLTTFNRPELLAQSLPAIVAQSRALGLDLLICDDGSTDVVTLRLLREATRSGARLLDVQFHDGLHAHWSLGRNFLRGVADLAERYGHHTAFVKLDDDIVLTDDALARLVDGWAKLPWAAALSGMMDGDKPALEEVSRGIWRTPSSCSVACVHRLDLWTDAILRMGSRTLLDHGWDCSFFGEYLPQFQPDLRCYTLCPSVAYHTGHMGVHGLDLSKLNRRPPDPFAFPGEWLDDRPRCVDTETPRATKTEQWLAVYGGRALRCGGAET